MDLRAIVFTALIATAHGPRVGLLPARRAARTDVMEGFRLSPRASTLGRHESAARGGVLTMQIALTVVCLGAAGLLIQRVLNVWRVDAGFASDRTLAVDVSLSPGRYGPLDARAAFVRNALQRLNAVPGVTSAGFVNKPPLSGISMHSVLVLEGTEQAAIPMVERPQADVRSADAGYFRTLGIRLLDGQLFQETEAGRTPDRQALSIVRAARRRGGPYGARLLDQFDLDANGAVRWTGTMGVGGEP